MQSLTYGRPRSSCACRPGQPQTGRLSLDNQRPIAHISHTEGTQMGNRTRHPSKEIEGAVRYAESEGWTVQNSSGHARGVMRCPWKDTECRCGVFCQRSIWSTPRVPEDMAALVRRSVDGCTHVQQRREEAARKEAGARVKTGREAGR